MYGINKQGEWLCPQCGFIYTPASAAETRCPECFRLWGLRVPTMPPHVAAERKDN